MNNIIENICDLLHKNESIVLARIIDNSGSTPRTAGTKMIVLKNGDIFGTIGGGLIEAKVIERAEDIFSSGKSCVQPFDLTFADADSMDMICGGKLTVSIEYIEPNEANKKIYSAAEKLETRDDYIFAFDLTHPEEPKYCIITSEGPIAGNRDLYPNFLTSEIKKIGFAKNGFTGLAKIDNRIFFIDCVKAHETLFIFGAGHISIQLAKLATMVDFYTVVIDDREKFANKERFGTVDKIMLVENFADVFGKLEINERSYIAILTRGHMHDKEVLKQALGTNAKYIGMIGSKRKRETIYNKLVSEGCSGEDLSLVHSPIGLSIGARTPEEIAISIVSELIGVRSDKKSGFL